MQFTCKKKKLSVIAVQRAFPDNDDQKTHSPDHALNYCFLWVYLKSQSHKVQAHQPQPLAIPPDITQRVMIAFKTRLEVCIENNEHDLTK